MFTTRVYTDGACQGNPGPGGWGVVVFSKTSLGEDVIHRLSGGEADTTNNRMELKAFIKALTYVHLFADKPTIVYSDSKYVIEGIEWMKKWKLNGWKTANKQPVKNEDLWRELDQVLISVREAFETSKALFQISWVKGHNGDPGNELADQLAKQGIPNV